MEKSTVEVINSEAAALVAAMRAKQIEAVGGLATLKGREVELAYHIQDWTAREVELGTNVNEVLASLFYGFSFNIVSAADNLARIGAGTREECIAILMNHLHKQVVRTNQAMHKGGTPIIATVSPIERN